MENRILNFATVLEESSKVDAEQSGEIRPYDVSSSATVNRNDGTIVSLSVRIEYYSGGANTGSDSYFKTILNEASGQQLDIGNLFLLGTDYTSLLNGRVADMIDGDDSMRDDFTFTTIAADQWFYLTDTELVIVFPRYDIAPGVAGEPEFRIPLSSLSDVLIPQLQ